jgi:uncharacterized protein (TIGR03437 family)
VTQASWEIRTGMSAGAPGTVVASGIDAATQTLDPLTGTYRIQVNGLQVRLGAGTYWLSVSPVGLTSGQSYVGATLGANAVGVSLSNKLAGLYHLPPSYYGVASSAGSGGTSSEFSQGVLIDASSAPALTTSEKWQANVSSLVQQIQATHGLPFPGISLPDFTARAADLYNQIPILSEPEIQTRLQALVASIEDSHTNVSWGSPSPFHVLPLSFYWFDDGIYITGAAAQYGDLLGGRLIAVGDTPIRQATDALTALVPHENDQWPKYRIAGDLLTNAEFLFGTGLIAGTDRARLQVQTASGAIVSPEVQSFPQYQRPPLNAVFQGAAPLYRQHENRRYWATVTDAGATVYFQYNSCMEDPQRPSADFFQELDQLLAQAGVQRIVLDMRNNTGGLASILNPWIEKIKASRFNEPGRLYVIVGRATFSAAMEATNLLHDGTAAIFVGEPTGAKPRFLLRRGDFGLPYFGIRVSYTSGVERANDAGASLIPDIPAGLTFYDYMNGVDPSLEAILRIPPPSLSGKPTISPGGVIGASAFGGFPGIAPGTWIEIHGANLSATTRAWSGSDFVESLAPASLDGVKVTIGGLPAYIAYVSATQINALVPSDAPVGSAQLIVSGPTGVSDPYEVDLQALRPGRLAPPSFQVNGVPYAAALHTDGTTFVLPAGAITGLPSRPASPGDTILLYGIGFGPVTPEVPAGTLTGAPSALTTPLEIYIGNKPAALAYYGLAPGLTGIYQFNVVVPEVPDNAAAALTFNLGGVAGKQTLHIAVQR